MNKLLLLTVSVFLVVAGGALWLRYGVSAPARMACTTEARLCPDGSAVGREGPNCEFAACPETGAAEWELYDGNTPPFASFRYPAKLPTRYLQAVNWPPHVIGTSTPYACVEKEAQGRSTKRRVISGREYCVTTVTEGAAGSVYTDHTYVFDKEGTAILNFSTRMPQCGNYDAEERSLCGAEKGSFDIDALVDRIVSSLTFY